MQGGFLILKDLENRIEAQAMERAPDPPGSSEQLDLPARLFELFVCGSQSANAGAVKVAHVFEIDGQFCRAFLEQFSNSVVKGLNSESSR